jgi:hypothetical protein
MSSIQLYVGLVFWTLGCGALMWQSTQNPNSATTLNLIFSIFTISELSDMRLGQFDHADFKSENRF